MTEAYASIPNMQKYYGRVENGQIVENGSHIPFNFELILNAKDRYSNAKNFKEHINLWLNSMPKGKGIQSNWVVSWVLHFVLFFSLIFGIFL